ncbi:lipopolysaccharide heptosyltransferase family protein, partial [Vibrio mimicus]
SEKINEINDKIVQESSLSVVLLSSPDTRDLIEKLPISFSERIVHFDESESIYDAIAAVKLAEFIISVDTSIVHIATGLDKKQIAIYSQDVFNFNNWHPCSNLSRIVRTKSNINDYSTKDLCLEEYI